MSLCCVYRYQLRALLKLAAQGILTLLINFLAYFLVLLFPQMLVDILIHSNITSMAVLSICKIKNNNSLIKHLLAHGQRHERQQLAIAVDPDPAHEHTD